MGKAGLIIIAFFICIALYAEVFIDYDKYVHFMDEKNQSFSLDHLFGTDQYGRDVFERVAVGTTPSLIIGFTAMVISMGLGTVVGLASGYWGGWRDEVLMRINDMFLSIPWLVLMIVIAAIFNARSLWAVVLVIGLTGWSTNARIVRAQVLTLKERQFIVRAQAIGAGDWHIIGKHIFRTWSRSCSRTPY
jgi:peptide/nickel transport system permease protein